MHQEGETNWRQSGLAPRKEKQVSLPAFEEHLASYEWPMHSPRARLPAAWVPCEHPERVYDEDMQVDFRCRACVVALGAAAMAHPQRIRRLRRVANVSLSEVYEWAREYHGLPPLPERVNSEKS